MKKTFALLCAAAVLFTACSAAPAQSVSSTARALATRISDTQITSRAVQPTSDSVITLNGDTASYNGAGGVNIDGAAVTITGAGTYTVAGTLADGQLAVDTVAGGTVNIVLNGADITNTTGAPLVVWQAEEVVITLANGTQNTLTDAAAYADATSEVSACLYSKDDLWLCGNGVLTVNANHNNGIQSKDTLTVAEGTYTVISADDAIVGKDSILMGTGSYTLTAGGDGVKATNAEDAALGTVALLDGTYAITAENDAIQAETTLAINGGSYTILTGGGTQNAEQHTQNEFFGRGGQAAQAQEATMATTTTTESESRKGLKAGAEIVINDGTFTMDTCDDAIHANGNVTVNGGSFAIATGDDGFHADETLTISGGEISISQSYEALEGLNISITGGIIDVTASDDGVNAAGGDGSGQYGFAQDSFSAGGVGGTGTLSISGGTLVIHAGGDGIDINGSGEMTGGNVTVYGPVDGSNGALDYDGTFTVGGGEFICFGSMAMALSPTAGGTQPLLVVNGTLNAGARLAVLDASGAELYAAVTEKASQHSALSSAALTEGSTVTVMLDGTALATLTLARGTNTAGEAMGGRMGQGGMGGGKMGEGGMGGKGDVQNGGTPPELPEGEMPVGGTPPEIPTGEAPTPPDGTQGVAVPAAPAA